VAGVGEARVYGWPSQTLSEIEFNASPVLMRRPQSLSSGGG